RDAASQMLHALKSMGFDLDATAEGGAASVDKKLKELTDATSPYEETMQQFQGKLQAGAADSALESIQKAPDEIKQQLYIEFANNLAAKGEGARARQILNDYISNPY